MSPEQRSGICEKGRDRVVAPTFSILKQTAPDITYFQFDLKELSEELYDLSVFTKSWENKEIPVDWRTTDIPSI